MAYKVKSQVNIEEVNQTLNSMCIVMIPKQTYDSINKHATDMDLSFGEFLSKAIDFYLKKEVK